MSDEKRQAFTVRLDPEQHEWMRRQAFEQRVSMQRVIEDAIYLLRHTPEWAGTLGDAGNRPPVEPGQDGQDSGA